jgi:fido (protein-threonine AMPylation protein)
MPDDPYADPVTGVLRNKLGLMTPAGLEAAEREITHAALIFLKESPVQPRRRCGRFARHAAIVGYCE